MEVVDTEQRKGSWKWEKEILRGSCNGETTQKTTQIQYSQLKVFIPHVWDYTQVCETQV